MKALTLQEAKDQVAKKYGLQSWDEDVYRDIGFNWEIGNDYHFFTYEELYDEAALLYSKSCQEASIRALVKEFQAEFQESDFRYMDFAADRFITAIRLTPLIER